MKYTAQNIKLYDTIVEWLGAEDPENCYRALCDLYRSKDLQAKFCKDHPDVTIKRLRAACAYLADSLT